VVLATPDHHRLAAARAAALETLEHRRMGPPRVVVSVIPDRHRLAAARVAALLQGQEVFLPHQREEAAARLALQTIMQALHHLALQTIMQVLRHLARTVEARQMKRKAASNRLASLYLACKTVAS
jgi:hypothetical protein